MMGVGGSLDLQELIEFGGTFNLDSLAEAFKRDVTRLSYDDRLQRMTIHTAQGGRLVIPNLLSADPSFMPPESTPSIPCPVAALLAAASRAALLSEDAEVFGPSGKDMAVIVDWGGEPYVCCMTTAGLAMVRVEGEGAEGALTLSGAGWSAAQSQVLGRLSALLGGHSVRVEPIEGSGGHVRVYVEGDDGAVYGWSAVHTSVAAMASRIASDSLPQGLAHAAIASAYFDRKALVSAVSGIQGMLKLSSSTSPMHAPAILSVLDDGTAVIGSDPHSLPTPPPSQPTAPFSRHVVLDRLARSLSIHSYHGVQLIPMDRSDQLGRAGGPILLVSSDALALLMDCAP